VAWSVRSGDYLARRPEAVVAKVMREVQPGSIVLLHEGRNMRPAIRVKAIALLLEALAARNYRCILPDPSRLR
jgi:peptidoglycan/xylan/chitin deacetylase (PgdA/CDA1 family)